MDNLNIRKKIPVVLMVIGLTISIVSLIMLAINAFTVQITVPYEGCDFMFGCSTEEFFDRDLELYKEIGDLRKFAYIAKNGELNVIVTRKQANLWANILEQQIREIEKTHANIEVSSDCFAIVVYSCAETFDEDENAVVDVMILSTYIRTLRRSEDLIHFTSKDAATGKDVEHFTVDLKGNIEGGFVDDHN